MSEERKNKIIYFIFLLIGSVLVLSPILLPTGWVQGWMRTWAFISGILMIGSSLWDLFFFNPKRSITRPVGIVLFLASIISVVFFGLVRFMLWILSFRSHL